MKINVSTRNHGSGILIIILILIVTAGFFTILGYSLLRSAGVECFKEIKNRMIHNVEVPAFVKDVERSITEDEIIGYKIFSYDYNEQHYEVRIENYVEERVHYSSEGSKDKPESSKLAEERSEKRWQKLRSTIGKEGYLLIDPNKPSEPSIRMEDEGLRILVIMTLLGLLPFIVLIILAISLVLIIRKKTRNRSEEYDY